MQVFVDQGEYIALDLEEACVERFFEGHHVVQWQENNPGVLAHQHLPCRCLEKVPAESLGAFKESSLPMASLFNVVKGLHDHYDNFCNLYQHNAS